MEEKKKISKVGFIVALLLILALLVGAIVSFVHEDISHQSNSEFDDPTKLLYKDSITYDSNGNMLYDYNQIVQNGNFENTNNINGRNNTISVNNNILTVNTTDLSNNIYMSFPTIQDHKYLVSFNAYSDVNILLTNTWYGALGQNFSLTNNLTQFNRIINNTYASYNEWRLEFNTYNVVTYYLNNVQVFDLTSLGIDTTDVTNAISMLALLNIDINTYNYYSLPTQLIYYSQQNYNTYGTQQYSAGHEQGYYDGVDYADGRVNTSSASYDAGYDAGIIYADGRVNQNSESYYYGERKGRFIGDTKSNRLMSFTYYADGDEVPVSDGAINPKGGLDFNIDINPYITNNLQLDDYELHLSFNELNQYGVATRSAQSLVIVFDHVVEPVQTARIIYSYNGDENTYYINTIDKYLIFEDVISVDDIIDFYITVDHANNPIQSIYTTSYDAGYYNGFDEGYDDGVLDGTESAIDSVYVNNPFYHALVRYYTTLSSASPWFSFMLDNDLLQNSNTFDVNQAIKFYLNVQTQQDFYDSQDIGYFKIDFAKSFAASEMVYLINAQYPFQFDHYFTFYFEDGSQYVFHNDITQEHYYQYTVDLSDTDKNGMRVTGMSFRRGASDMINSVSQSQYNIGYNDGYSNGYISGTDDGYDSGYDSGHSTGVDEGYTTGYSVGYTAGSNADETLKQTVFTIADVPVRVFKQIFSFDILGINIAGIVLSIMSLFLVIWLVRRLK